MQPKYIFAALAVGGLVALLTSQSETGSSAPGTTPAPAPTKTTVPGTKTTQVQKATTTTPTGATVTTTTTKTVNTAMHGFTDVLTVANIWNKPVTSLANALMEGGKILMMLPSKVYLGTLISSKGDQLQFMIKTNSGHELKFWANQNEVKLMSATERNAYMQVGGGKFMAPEKLAALDKYLYPNG